MTEHRIPISKASRRTAIRNIVHCRRNGRRSISMGQRLPTGCALELQACDLVEAPRHLHAVQRLRLSDRTDAWTDMPHRPACHEKIKAYINPCSLGCDQSRHGTAFLNALRSKATLTMTPWLREIEGRFALIMEPRSKFDRLVLADVLAAAGMTLVAEAEQFSKSDWQRAKGVRNGLMIALLALCPIRLKNFAALELGSTVRNIDGAWWIILPPDKTKTGRLDERQIPNFLKGAMDRYVSRDREILARGNTTTNELWLPATSGKPMTYKMSGFLSQGTYETVRVDVSPHLLPDSGASTAAIHSGETPYLASAILSHRPQNYRRTLQSRDSMSAAQAYAAITDTYRHS